MVGPMLLARRLDDHVICERRSPSCGLLGLVRAYFAADGMGNGIRGKSEVVIHASPKLLLSRCKGQDASPSDTRADL